MATATVDLEYIGDPPIFDDMVRARIALGELDSRGAAVLRAADNQRLKAIKGITRRIVDVESFHTSREYVFGPEVFVVAVDRRDAQKILDSEAGYQFRLVSESGIEVITPSQHVMLMGEEIEGGLSLLDKKRP